MEYKTKSLLINRLKDYEHIDKDQPYNVQIKLFKINDPHLTPELPIECIDFEDISEVYVDGFKEMKFLPVGNDLVINNLSKVKIDKKKDKVYISNI